MRMIKFGRLAKAATIITLVSLFAISCNNSTQTSEEKKDTTAMTTPEPTPVPTDTMMAPPNPNPCMVDFKADGKVSCKGTCDSGSCDLYKRGKKTANPWRKTSKEQEADTTKWEYHCWCFDPNRTK
jgi:hypothetical protein